VIEKLQSQLTEVQRETKHEEQPSIPKWFSDVYGADPTLWTQYSTMETQRRTEIKQEIFGEMQAQQQAQQAQAKRWENWVAENVQALKDDGASFDENRLMDFVLKYRPIDEQGNIDIKKGYELYSQINQASQANPSMTARKQAAAGTMSSAREAAPQVGTPIEKLRRKSMLDLANEGL